MGKGSGASGARGGGSAGGAISKIMDAESQRELTATMAQRTSAGNIIDSTDTKAQALNKIDNAIADMEAIVSPTGRYQRSLDMAKDLPKGYPGRSAEIRRAEANLSTARADLAALKEVRSAIASGTKISVYTDASNKLHVRG